MGRGWNVEWAPRSAFARIARTALLLLVFPAATRASDLAFLPLESVGVDAPTVAAFQSLLLHEMEDRVDGRILRVAPARTEGPPCAAPECAAECARQHGVQGAIVGSLSRLGAKYVATLQRVDSAGRVVWSGHRTAARAEDLDAVAIALGRAIAEGHAEPETQRFAATDSSPVESPSAARRRVRQGPRVGTIHSAGEGFGGARQLTSLAYVWRFQSGPFDVEAVPILGYAWGGNLTYDGAEARDWSLLDLYITWTPAQGNFAPYVGGGMGLHAVRLETRRADGLREDAATGLALSTGAGVQLFRQADFQVVVDLRYQHFFGPFSVLDGERARGLALTLGIHHR